MVCLSLACDIIGRALGIQGSMPVPQWGGGHLEWVVESTTVTQFQCRLVGSFTSSSIDTR